MAQFHLLNIHKWYKNVAACSSLMIVSFISPFSCIKIRVMSKLFIVDWDVHDFSRDDVLTIFNLTNCFRGPVSLPLFVNLLSQIWCQFSKISTMNALHHIFCSQCLLSIFSKHNMFCVFTSNLTLDFLISTLIFLNIICNTTDLMRLLLLYHLRQ